MISQIDPVTNEEHPVAIESGAFKGAEVRYTTTEKEFFAIVKAFQRRRALLIQVESTVITDHRNLVYWMEPRQLNPRQARWADLLSGFSFKIVYRPGVSAKYPDALSRRPDYGDEYSHTTLIKALPTMDELAEGDDIGSESLRALLDAPLNSPPEPQVEFLDGALDLADIRANLAEDNELDNVIAELRLVPSATSANSATLANFARKLGVANETEICLDGNGILRVGGRAYVPKPGNLRLSLLRLHHDSSLAGHPGRTKMAELLRRSFCWLGLRRDIDEYVSGCAVCQRTKTSRQRPHGMLQPLEVAPGPWSSISMDFIEELPKSNGHNSVLVVVDRLTKWAIFIPTTTTISTAELVDILVDHVVCLHGLPASVVSDRGSKFTSHVWSEVMKALGTRLKMSTAFHPQTDGQTERVNQVLEQYLRIFCSYQQDDWSSLLPRAAFAYNNSYHSAIKMSPFMANYGCSARWVDDLNSPNSASLAPLVVDKVKSLSALHEACKERIKEANLVYAKSYDAKRSDEPDFAVGDLVLLSMAHIKTHRPMKKLDDKFSGPYKVLGKVGSRAYRLELPDTMKNHPVFHVSLLKAFRTASYPGQLVEPPGPIEVDGDNELEPEFEVKAVVDSKVVRGKLKYLVEWFGYENTPDATTWEPPENLDGCRECIEAFHARYPDKPSSSTLANKLTGTRRARRQ